jgi:hypothetical protein
LHAWVKWQEEQAREAIKEQEKAQKSQEKVLVASELHALFYLCALMLIYFLLVFVLV